MTTRRIEETVKTDYCPGWGLTEGIREFLQNARDAEIQYGAPMEISHKGDRLVIKNTGCILPLESLLLGHTTKVDRADLAGQYGEGLKIGILALVRAGHAVTIRTGGEVWTAELEQSRVFKCPVLTFYIKDGNTEKNRVQVEIDNVSAEQWSRIKPRFLWLQKNMRNTLKSQYGNSQVLLDPLYKGMLFVKGIYVSEDPRLTCGYDFYEAQVDRDRKMIEQYNLEYYIRNLWETMCLSSNPQSSQALEQYYRLLMDNSKDLQAYREPYNCQYLNDEIQKWLKHRFQEEHGPDAVPASSPDEALQVEHFGKRPIIVPEIAANVIWRSLGGKESVQKEFENAVLCVYNPGSLSRPEQTVLRLALSLVSHARPICEQDVQIVDFRTNALKGIFQGGNIMLARNLLSNPTETLATLIHEVAHHYGVDGSKTHVEALELIWATVAGKLMETAQKS